MRDDASAWVDVECCAEDPRLTKYWEAYMAALMSGKYPPAANEIGNRALEHYLAKEAELEEEE